MTRVTYREEGRTECRACKRNLAALRATGETQLRVARHLFQTAAPNADGHHTLDEDGFCPGSMEVAAPLETKKPARREIARR